MRGNEKSRESRNEISTRLAEQGLAALRELVRGYQAAHLASGKALSEDVLRAAPGDLHRMLVSLVMCLVFLLFAEGRGLLPSKPVATLFDRLRADASRFPDTMDRRVGAWFELLTVYVRVRTKMEPARGSTMDRYPYLEGRPGPPRVPDGVVLRMLERLLILDGERISYGDLDEEQLGSMYEAMMGFTVEVASGSSSLPPGTMSLRPTGERRRSGSHYTPRSLTGPIVRATLRPVLEALGPHPTPERLLDLKVCDPAVGSGAFLLETCRYLAERLVEAWSYHRAPPALAPDEEPLHHARRLVAKHCLYGVDRNPSAVEMARLSLWLLARAPEKCSFLDRMLQHGDALVGLSRARIVGFHWEPRSPQPLIQSRMDEGTPGDRRIIGDLVVAAFFAGKTPKVREHVLARSFERVTRWLRNEVPRHTLEADVVELTHHGRGPVPVFHWELEFPEVFTRENPGFDAFVGNPPFAGKNTIINANPDGYLPWLQQIHSGSHGNSDLVAHFFRRCYVLARNGGTVGLIATNTIAQGDTRATGLQWIRWHGGEIYEARRRLKWPGAAAVVVSVVHVIKGARPRLLLLDDRKVERISSFLFHSGADEDPRPLMANVDRAHIGSYVLGMGFTFDDTDKKGEASPLREMERLLRRDARNAERILPYLGGEELNDSPTHSPHRFVIHFGDLPESEARRWPDLLELVERKVRPKREKDNRASYRRYWWQFAEKRPDLYRRIRGLDRVLVISRVSHHTAFAFVPTRQIFSEGLVVFALDRYASLAALQSRPHELWTRFFGSSLEDRLRYTPSDCFETFPFPPGWEDPRSPLEEVGRAYDEHRRQLMIANGQGLTETYNRFHDPQERDPGILRLRELHAAMDAAVLRAYGWEDLEPRCEFLLDYEQDGGEARGRRKKPWRYRWPDGLRDEVLARLLDLNDRRADEERRPGDASKRART